MQLVRDSVAADQLVYAWPFPIGPEPLEVTCSNEEVIVMCPAWVVAEQLGPGHHRWRSPDPTKPTNAYFVLTAPVEAPFDMITSFVIPSTQQPVRLRAQGSMLVRCMDPATLISQFVGLPFDNVNDGVMRSVGLSVEKLLSRVLVRRVLTSGSPLAVTDPSMLPSIIDEATAYNPAAGAVSGVMFVRFNQLVVQADDGGMGGGMWTPQQGWGEASGQQHHQQQLPDNASYTGAGQPYPTGGFAPAYGAGAFAGDTGNVHPSHPMATGGFAIGSQPPASPSTASNVISAEKGVVASGEIGGNRRSAAAVAPVEEPLAPPVLAVGAQVLVSSEDGLLHSSTIRQHQNGYYEVEVDATGQTIWVPAAQVIPSG